MPNPEVDAYLAALPADQRQTLQTLHETLTTLLPDHPEVMSYAMPGLRQPGPKGRMVIGYAAFARHLGVYPHSGSTIAQLAAETAGFKTSKSGVLFPLTAPCHSR